MAKYYSVMNNSHLCYFEKNIAVICKKNYL